MCMKVLSLTSVDGRKILMQDKLFYDLIIELEFALKNMPFLNCFEFSKKVMFSHEIKNNNNIEGIIDDIDSIIKVVKEKKVDDDSKKQLRIFNLYKGYCYILKNSCIDKNSLKELYDILSNGLLDEFEKNNMGEFYRTTTGIILNKGRLDDSYDVTMDPELIDNYMNLLFEYIAQNNELDNMTEYFIKSMIVHFYFVCIHPYYDINGRISRTLAMWYLLNNKCYPYLLFNRAISFDFSDYDETIKYCKDKADVTSFIKKMLICVKKDIEKEYILNNINNSINSSLSTSDYQTLHYILSMNGLKSLMDFSTMYNLKNDKRKVIDIYKSMIEPLLDKGVLEIIRYTKKNYCSGLSNFEFKIKDKLIDKDERILKYIK